MIDTNRNMKLLKVEIDKNNKTKELLLTIRELEERLNKQSEDFNNYKKEMEKIHISLKKEMRITRNMKVEKIKGLTVI